MTGAYPVGLEGGVVLHQVPRIAIRRFVLGHRGRDDFERHAQLGEQFAAAGRSGGENEARHAAQLAGKTPAG